VTKIDIILKTESRNYYPADQPSTINHQLLEDRHRVLLHPSAFIPHPSVPPLAAALG
jgi:hypothetical protein